jgi:hypothetical protein
MELLLTVSIVTNLVFIVIISFQISGLKARAELLRQAIIKLAKEGGKLSNLFIVHRKEFEKSEKERQTTLKVLWRKIREHDTHFHMEEPLSSEDTLETTK